MEVANIVILCASLVTAVTVILTSMKKVLDKMLSPINKKIDCMDANQCKMYLLDFLNDVERGVSVDEVQYQLAHDVFDHYTNDLHKNSYIHDKWQRVMNKKG